MFSHFQRFLNTTMKGHTKCLYILVAFVFVCLVYLLQSKQETEAGLMKIIREPSTVGIQAGNVLERPSQMGKPQNNIVQPEITRLDIVQRVEEVADGNVDPTGNNGLHPDVKIVPSSAEPGLKLPYRDCFPMPEAPKERVQICIHPIRQDKGVSGNLKKGNLWEGHLIRLMDGRLKDDPSLMLFDIGCNLGLYSLWAAAIGRDVVAVEMLMDNVHLIQTAFSLSGLTDKLTLVNNALYKDHRTLEINFITDSIGASRLNTSNMFRTKNENRKTTYVQTICIDDLIPLMRGRNVYIKMDIENSEHTAIACAHKFFQEINVKVVQMEWHRRVPEESVPILEFMEKYGYVPSYTPIPYKPIDFAKDRRSIDVFFLKKSEYGIQ